MKYAVIKVVNSNYFVHSEGDTDPEKAIVKFHGLCQTLWNAPDVKSACVAIVDENLDIVEGYKETIRHSEVVDEADEEDE